MAKEILIPQQSFTGNEMYISEYLTYVYRPESDFFSNENVIVVFDGVRYECTRINEGEPSEGPNFYGANYDNETGFDWSEFPFSVITSTLGETPVEVYVTNSNEHTIEAYAGEDEEEPILYQHSNVRTQDNQIFYFDENTGDFIFFDGDSWGQNNDAWGKGIVPPKSKVAVVGTAIVGTDVVGHSDTDVTVVDSAVVDLAMAG